MYPARRLLRNRTQGAHERVDALFSVLDLQVKADYAVFLQCHAAALDVIARDWARCDLMRFDDVRAAVLQDLGALGVSAVATQGKRAPVQGALGVAYVLGGSHFGKEVLRRRWAQSQDATVLSAGAYLSGDTFRLAWGRVMSALEAAQPAELEEAVLGADWTFGLFEDLGRAHIDHTRVLDVA